MGEPFGCVIVDCVGPLQKAKSGKQFILTIMCHSFSVGNSSCKITVPVVIEALMKFKFFCIFGLPKVVQMDQGTNFMSLLH